MLLFQVNKLKNKENRWKIIINYKKNRKINAKFDAGWYHKVRKLEWRWWKERVLYRFPLRFLRVFSVVLFWRVKNKYYALFRRWRRLRDGGRNNTILFENILNICTFFFPFPRWFRVTFVCITPRWHATPV